MLRSVKRTDLIYDYPEELIATEPKSDYRCMLWQSESTGGVSSEVSAQEVIEQFETGDVLVINDTKVLRRRLFNDDGVEILFLKPLGELSWEVLFPARKVKVGQTLPLPGGRKMTLTTKGLPQMIETDLHLSDAYFEEYGELALPPYIQKVRGERHMKPEDLQWYQTEWAKYAGSCAAPTASLHFSQADLNAIAARGVSIVKVTLHVGLGTFLPIKTDDLNEHKMHSEWGRISKEACEQIESSKKIGGRVWALGTTATRVLESWQAGLLAEESDGGFSGETKLFIQPGYEFKAVDVLMTNFHQPESTLLCLVSAFAGKENMFAAYQWAIDKKFRLFSYGDLSIWKKL